VVHRFRGSPLMVSLTRMRVARPGRPRHLALRPQVPAMHPWPTLWLTPGAVPPQSVPGMEVAAPLCEVGCTSAMDGLSEAHVFYGDASSRQ
jgi:hypothetical protein